MKINLVRINGKVVGVSVTSELLYKILGKTILRDEDI